MIRSNINNITKMSGNYVGAHINREKTILKTMETITKKGGNCLQLFVSNPRSLSLVNIDNYINISSFYCSRLIINIDSNNDDSYLNEYF